ncbi:MAG: imidazole glycerol phosphate synthase subunit HisH [Candidatus Eisenbacteria bacterium]
MRVTLFDYGAGNLHSLAKALAGDGADVRLERDPAATLATDVLVLPGVGAFGPAAAALAPARERVRDALAAGLPCLAICLGMQLLFDGSDEGPGLGVGLVPGRVRALRARRVPHMGWNEVRPAGDGAAAPALALPPIAYFAHSFACAPDDDRGVTAWTTHEDDRFPAAVRVANTVGVQFHPEKSSAAGVAFLRGLLAGVRARAGARGSARP